MSDTARRKRIKTLEKVISFMHKNDDIVSKYGSIEALKRQYNLYCTSRCIESKNAYKDYKSYTRRKRFIDNNFHLYSATMLNERESDVVNDDENNNNDTNEEEEAENGGNRADVVPGQDNNNESNNSNNRDNQNEMLSHEESLDMKCHNCRRKQCTNLINRYGNAFRMELYRYVFIVF